MKSISQKIRLESQKIRLRNFRKNFKSKGKKRKRKDSNSEDDQYDKYCALCKATGEPFWIHNTEDCRTLAEFGTKKQRAIHGITKKEFHDLVYTK